jgi:hypothetical protein
LTTLELARIVNYDRNSSFIVLATVITIVNYDCKTFIVQATVRGVPEPSVSVDAAAVLADMVGGALVLVHAESTVGRVSEACRG